MQKDKLKPNTRLTPNQRRLLEQLAASPDGEVVLPFRKAEVARVLWRRGLVASYTSRAGTYVIQTQAAADRELARRKAVDLTQDVAATQIAPEAKARRILTSDRLTRLERVLTGAAWHAYMAGRHAVNRDDSLRKAAETRDIAFRKIYVRSAREWHHCYLKSSRSCRHLMGVGL